MQSRPALYLLIFLLHCLLVFGTPFVDLQLPTPIVLSGGTVSVTVTTTAAAQTTTPKPVCLVKRCFAGLASFEVSCTLLPFMGKGAVDPYLWCGAMTFNAIENLPEPCRGCRILRNVKKYGPYVGVAGIGGVLIYHNRHIFKGKNAAKETISQGATRAFEKAKIEAV